MDHPFAAHLRALGKGPNMARSLDRREARAAMDMVLTGEASPMQVAAFLMLLRRNGETADELAGMVEAVRDLVAGVAGLRVDLDWPSYAEPQNQQPWFLLAALALAAGGVRVLMHGLPGEADRPVLTRQVLAALDLEPAAGLAEAKAGLDAGGFAYVGLETLVPAFHRLFGYRRQLGVRTCVNTVARALNPGRAAAQVIGVAHPAYRGLHQQVSCRLGQPRAAVLKGGGGEFQRNPLKPAAVAQVVGGEAADGDWPGTGGAEGFNWRAEPLDAAPLVALWRGETAHPAAEAAITATLAVALHTLGNAATMEAADALAREMWRDRHARQGGGKAARRA